MSDDVAPALEVRETYRDVPTRCFCGGQVLVQRNGPDTSLAVCQRVSCGSAYLITPRAMTPAGLVLIGGTYLGR